MKKYLLGISFILLFQTIHAQQFYRIKTDVSIKDKLSNGTYRLTVGKAYYDKLYQKLVYKLTFPEAETIIIQDTTLYKIGKDGLLKSQQGVMVINEFTIFHLALAGKLGDYGINSGQGAGIYKITKVEKEPNGRVVSTWSVIDKRMTKYLGKIMMANLNKRLDAIAFYDTKDKLLSRQFFKDYTNVKGVEFPTQVTQISYNTDNTQNIQQTTYKNIVIDQEDEDEMYRFKVPITKSATARKQPAKSTKQK